MRGNGLYSGFVSTFNCTPVMEIFGFFSSFYSQKFVLVGGLL